MTAGARVRRRNWQETRVHRTALRTLAAAAGLCALNVTAQAGEAYFKIPSGNLYCAYFDYDGPPEVRCDIKSFTPTLGKRPADCDLDWGDAFAITATARKGSIVCHGDTVISDQAATLGYGKSWNGTDITCTSETSVLTCKNAKGHGFILSRREQNVF